MSETKKPDLYLIEREPEFVFSLDDEEFEFRFDD